MADSVILNEKDRERMIAERLKTIPEDIDDIVFANRNKAYGAYYLRKLYARHVITATIVAIGFSLAIIGANLIAKALGNASADEQAFRMKEVELLPPPPMDPNEPPPPPPPEVPPPPKVATVKFLPPEIKPDEEGKQEELPPEQDELKDKQISTVTQEGTTGEDVIIEPNEGTGEKEVVDEGPKDEIFTAVEIQPTFPGGYGELQKWLSKNIKYPKAAQRANVQGKVFVSFVVDEYGRISNPSILKGLGFGLDEEALRAVGAMPNWVPGKQGGRSVKVRYQIPINFTLSN
jgi:protein TonB